MNHGGSLVPIRGSATNLLCAGNMKTGTGTGLRPRALDRAAFTSPHHQIIPSPSDNSITCLKCPLVPPDVKVGKLR